MESFIILNLFFLIIFYFFNLKAYKIASFINLFDKPNKRKIHKIKIPLIGGILIWFVFGVNLLTYYFFFNLEIVFLKFFLLSTIFFFVGLIDDKFSLKANFRLFVLFFVSIILYKLLNIREIEFILIDKIGLFHIYYGGIFLTVFCVLLFQNSMNMIDGLNGLSTSIFIGILLFLLLKNQTTDNYVFIQLILFLLIFLIFNLSNKIFLGDSGIYFISSFIGMSFIYLSQYQSNLTVNSIFLIMILPGIDMLRVFIKRVLNKKLPFAPDKNHIHHIFIKSLPYKTSLSIILFLSFFPILAYEILKVNFFVVISIFFIIYFWLINKIMKSKTLKN